MDRDDARLWLERLHAGVQGGIGRKPWNSEQKTRFSGDRKNKIAQSLLDYAEEKGFLNKQQRRNRLTTVQRYLSNPLVRKAMGIDAENADNVSRNRPEPEFDEAVKKFIDDLLHDRVSSRSNKPQIEQYAQDLRSIEALSSERVEPYPLSGVTEDKVEKPRKPQKPPKAGRKKPKYIPYDKEIAEKLEPLGSQKLKRLYWSVCAIKLDDHAPLITVGVWAFLESLTGFAGRSSNTSFADYLSKNRLRQMGFDKSDTQSLTDALDRLSKGGNITKHHQVSATFGEQQLVSDMETLKPVVVKLCEEARQHS